MYPGNFKRKVPESKSSHLKEIVIFLFTAQIVGQ